MERPPARSFDGPAFDVDTAPESSSPLLLPGVHAFNAARWGLRPEVITLGTPGDATVTTLLYANRRGRLVQPPLTPYTPIEFCVPEGTGPRRRSTLWLDLGGALAAVMRERGLRGILPLSPEIDDARPWQWRGFEAHLRYTFILPFPIREQDRSPSVRRRIRQASDQGMTCRRETESGPVLACLQATERRKGFRDDLTDDDLALARELIGDEHVRMYSCRLADGDVASARVVLHRPGSLALGWVAGTREVGLPAGASQLLVDFILSDLEAEKATGLDFSGANIESIAHEKKGWGADLTSYPVVSLFGARSVAIGAKRWLHASRRTG